jgi:uncharacterized protein (TIGR03437 family)
MDELALRDGITPVTVTTPNGTSVAVNTTAALQSPAFFLWIGKYAVATRQDYSVAIAPGTFPGAATVAAKPVDILILWATGLGPTTPSVPVGIQVPGDQLYSASTVTVTIGGVSAQVFGAALAPGYAGLYQVAIQVPANLPDGDQAIKANVGGAAPPDGVFLTVQH